MRQASGSSVLALAAALRQAAEAVASAPTDHPSALLDRIAALGSAASAVQGLLAEPRAVGERDRRLVRNEVRMARVALGRCLRARNSLRDMATLATGRYDEYGRDGTVAAVTVAGRPVRHV